MREEKLHHTWSVGVWTDLPQVVRDDDGSLWLQHKDGHFQSPQSWIDEQSVAARSADPRAAAGANLAMVLMYAAARCRLSRIQNQPRRSGPAHQCRCRSAG